MGSLHMMTQSLGIHTALFTYRAFQKHIIDVMFFDHMHKIRDLVCLNILASTLEFFDFRTRSYDFILLSNRGLIKDQDFKIL